MSLLNPSPERLLQNHTLLRRPQIDQIMEIKNKTRTTLAAYKSETGGARLQGSTLGLILDVDRVLVEQQDLSG